MEFLRVFIRRPIFTAMLAVALLVFGLFSLPKIGVDQYPNVEVPVVTVTTTYPGADPESVERDVSKILEEPLATLSGLESIKSVNVESLSQIVMQFKLEKSADIAAQEVRDKVAAELSRLPAEAKTPVVAKFDVGAAPIMTLALSAPVPVEKLTRLAKDLVKVELQQQDGVGEVEVVGGREREVRVVVDLDRLRAHGLAASDVAQAVKSQSIDSPSGRTLEGSRERIVRLES